MLLSVHILFGLLVPLTFLKTNVSDIHCPVKYCKCHNRKIECKKHGHDLWFIPKMSRKTTVLIFTGNYLPSVTQNTFQNISILHLEELVLGGNKIRNISRDAFEFLKDLKFLDLSGNQPGLDNLKSCFHGLRNHRKLYKLFLLQMDLSYIPNDMFEVFGSTALNGLSLNFNNISYFDGAVFSNLPKIMIVALNNNSISSVSLKGAHFIKILRLRGNALKVVPDFCDANGNSFVENLTVIDLGQNSIMKIEKKMFLTKCLPNLRNLSLDENFIHVVPNNVFSDLKSLVRLSLRWLRQNVIYFEKMAFNSSSMRQLYIANHISLFPYHSQSESMKQAIDYKNLFRYCPNLNVLEMTKIRMTTTKGDKVFDLLHHLKNLTKLVLQSTSILTLPEHLFSSMPYLKSLNLQYCLISSWKPGVFKGVHSLTTLYLDGNEINIINSTSFPGEMLKNIKKLSLGKNPFSCTCELVWFQEWIKNHNKILYSWPDSYTCKTPSEWRGRKLSQFKLSYSFCNPLSPYVIAAISVICSLVFITAICSLIYKYRWDIKYRYYMYLSRAEQNGYQRLPGNDGFLYDAFVAYNSEDRVWIISEIIPVMEKKEKLKLCLHDRDFDVGKVIIDNINEKIKGSRKVVLILSNNFARCQWCNFEMMMAQLRYLEEGENTLIVVMLEKIESKNLSNSLCVLLKTARVVEWRKTDEKLFWKTLISFIKSPN